MELNVGNENQPEGEVSDTGNAGAEGSAEEGIQPGQDSTEGEGNLGVGEVPPELKAKEKELMRAWHEKNQAAAERQRTLDEKQKALDGVYNQEWFRKALADERERRAGRVSELTPEAFEALKNDPRAFQEYFLKREEAMEANLKSQFAPEIEKLGKSQQELAASREYDSVKDKYGEEFVSANKEGALDKYIDKGFDYDVAFKLHMQDQGKVAGAKQENPAARRAAAIEKGGLSKSRGGPIHKVGTLEDALSMAISLSQKGVKDFTLERK